MRKFGREMNSRTLYKLYLPVPGMNFLLFEISSVNLICLDFENLYLGLRTLTNVMALLTSYVPTSGPSFLEGLIYR